LYYQLFGTKEEWEIQIKSQDKKIRNVLLKSITVIDFETKRNGELVNPQRAFRYYGKVAYLNPGGFSSSEADGEAVFKQFIDSVFMDLKLSGRRDLIIDLRNNPGGHNAYSDYLIGYFATKPFKWYSEFTLKTSEILKAQIRLQSDTTDAYSKAILSNNDGITFNYEFESQSPVLSSKRFQGNVYVLVNRQTYSMAAVAASLIQDYKFGRIVGEETGDPPTLYASQFSYQLPRTGVTVKVPKGYIIRPNGDRSFNRLKPDVISNDHLLGGNDEILNRILKKMKTGK
jgi:C-terminal processing protease CtpA/Prc